MKRPRVEGGAGRTAGVAPRFRAIPIGIIPNRALQPSQTAGARWYAGLLSYNEVGIGKLAMPMTKIDSPLDTPEGSGAGRGYFRRRAAALRRNPPATPVPRARATAAVRREPHLASFARIHAPPRPR
jgi:hypothetical protein